LGFTRFLLTSFLQICVGLLPPCARLWFKPYIDVIIELFFFSTFPSNWVLFQVIVLLVGTNNHGDSADEIADGIRAIITLMRDKQPQAYLVCCWYRYNVVRNSVRLM
jgi:hypothetical protein